MAAGGMLGVSVRRSKSKPLYHTLVVVSMGHILYMSTVGLAAGGRGERRKRAAQQASPRSLLHARLRSGREEQASKKKNGFSVTVVEGRAEINV